jgi:hypothetical protein
MANPRDRNDPLRRLARAEEEIRKLKLAAFGEAPAAVSSSTFLRVTWCGGASSEADFNGSTNSFEKLLTFEDPSSMVQSGGFVFSDHPTAASIDWAGPTVVGPNHTLHRITVPEDGTYSVTVNYFMGVSFTSDVNYIQVETKIWPDTSENNSWFHPFLLANTSTAQQATDATFTVEIAAATPVWITARPFGMLSDGTEASGDLGSTTVSDASLSVFK